MATFEHISYFMDPLHSKKLANPIIEGFPLYGLGGLFLYSVFKYLQLDPSKANDAIAIALISAIFGTSLEFIVGYFVGAGEFSTQTKEDAAKYGINSWDYGGEPYSYRGVISARHALYWTICGLALAKYSPALEKFIYAGLGATT